MGCWSRTPAWPKTCPAPDSIDATLPVIVGIQELLHLILGLLQVGLVFLGSFSLSPAGTLDHQGHLTPDAVQLLHGPSIAIDVEQGRQGPSLGLPLPVAILIIGSPKPTTDRLSTWSQASFHLLPHILLGVEAGGEAPVPQVRWMCPGLEGYQLLPLQLLGPLGWIETSVCQPPNSSKLAKFSEVMVAHPCEEGKLEGRVGWSHHCPIELQFLHWCVRKLRVKLGGKLPRVAGLQEALHLLVLGDHCLMVDCHRIVHLIFRGEDILLECCSGSVRPIVVRPHQLENLQH